MDLVARGILLSVSLLTASVVNAAIYQCADGSGKKVFQDTPCSAAQKPIEVQGPTQEALALAQAMQMEIVVKEAFQVVVERNIRTGRATQAELDCIKRAELPFVNDVYAAGFARVLTADEMKEALTFFSKPTGQWFLKWSRDAQARGLTAAVPEDMTEEQSADLSTFMSSTAWQKLLEQRQYETPELKNALGAKMAAIILGCKNR
jgi:hypothetical protein